MLKSELVKKVDKEGLAKLIDDSRKIAQLEWTFLKKLDEKAIESARMAGLWACAGSLSGSTGIPAGHISSNSSFYFENNRSTPYELRIVYPTSVSGLSIIHYGFDQAWTKLVDYLTGFDVKWVSENEAHVELRRGVSVDLENHKLVIYASAGDYVPAYRNMYGQWVAGGRRKIQILKQETEELTKLFEELQSIQPSDLKV